ncbi:hypothetical protein M8J75_005105 [Diaphorina citri]|nr:hypothetical protein M8J75_005105 [Diaphorina citri]
MRVNLDPTLSIKREHLKAHKNTHNDVYKERNSNRINKNYVNNARKVWRGKYANISNEIHREILYELDHLDPYFLIESRSEYIQNKYKNLVTQMKILHGSTKISPSDITELNAWLIHHGTDTTPTQPKTNQAHRYLNLIGRLSGFLCDSTVVYTDLMTKGTQLKFLLTLAHPSDGKNNHAKVKAITTTEKHTLRAVFKPKWYSNNITFPGVVDGKDRHYGEYIGFLLSLLLELYTVPVTLLRSFPMSHFLATASPRLNTTYFPGPHNTSCYMGKCLYCTRDEALCAGKTVAGAVILYLENTPVEKLPSPYQRSYGGKTKAWERDEKYCLDNVAQRRDREFILDLVDVAVFDFLMQNGDRHHLEKTKEVSWSEPKDVHNNANIDIDRNNRYGNIDAKENTYTDDGIESRNDRYLSNIDSDKNNRYGNIDETNIESNNIDTNTNNRYNNIDHNQNNGYNNIESNNIDENKNNRNINIKNGADKSLTQSKVVDKLLLLDNGKSFGNPALDNLDILAPLYQCCVLRVSTYNRLVQLRGGLMIKILKQMSGGCNGEEVLTEDQWRGMQRRLTLVYAAVNYCVRKHQGKTVLVK